jgi:hypothetical protein
MGILDRFREGMGVQRPVTPEIGSSAEDQAIERYRYMLRTAPPETIEQAHAEAIAKLTPEQRQRVLQELSNEIPEGERAAAARAGFSPEDLARTATRAEVRQPGVMERTFGGLGAGQGGAMAPGFGGLLAGSFLSSMAGTVLGSMIGQHFFNSHPEAGHLFGDTAGQTGESQAHAADDHGANAQDSDVASSDSTGADDFGTGDDFGSGFDGGDWDV